MYQVKDGPASKSYGIQVAKLAGVPDKVLDAAKNRLRELEQSVHDTKVNLETTYSGQGSLFENDQQRQAVEVMEQLDPDSISPRDAHELLYKLKKLLNQ